MTIKAEEVARMIVMYSTWDSFREPDRPGGRYYWHTEIDGITSNARRDELARAFKKLLPSTNVHVTDYGHRKAWTVTGDAAEIKQLRDELLDSRDKRGYFTDRHGAKGLSEQKRTR